MEDTEFSFFLQDRIQKIQQINNEHDLEKNAYISFSGGKDSTVLHYLIDEALPGNTIPRLFLNTGIEYKQILNFVKLMAKNDKRIIIYNVGVNIPQMLKTVGYPFKSKEHSQKVFEWRKGYRSKSYLKYFRLEEGGFNKCPKDLLYQLEDNTLKISHLCCFKLKKEPAKKWAADNNREITITGMRQSEHGQRQNISCIVSDKNNKVKKFHPLAVVSEEFENEYIKTRNIKLCDLYYPPYNLTRTGCKGCPYTPWLEKDLYMMGDLLPEERKQCELIWKPVYKEYRRLSYRLKPIDMFDMEFING